MSALPPPNSAASDAATATAREVWTLMSDLVLDHQRRREVADALGLSFSRIRAVRRLASESMSMRGFAEAMGIDPPNATAVVNDLESLGLVRRLPHPSDRRVKVLEATRKGKALARRANAILGTPPPAITALSPEDLVALRRILEAARKE